MKLLENGTALEFVEDLLQDGEVIDPGDLIDDGIMEPKPLTESDKKFYRESLKESKKSEASILEYLKTARNPSFNDYKDSDYYVDSIKTGWYFNQDVKKLAAKGMISSQMASNALQGARKPDSPPIGGIGSAVSEGGGLLKRAIGGYERPKTGTVKANHLTGIQKKYELDTIDMNSAGTAEEMYDDMESTIRDILTQDSVTRHALIFGDPGIGKTYTCRKIMEETPSELVKKYYKGNIGKSLTSCCAFFYKYSNGYFIMLDDNDAMIMKQGASQQIKLFFKGLLDPDPGPIAVPTTVLKGASRGLEEYEKEEERNKGGMAKRRKRAGTKKKESIRIDIDKDLLREGVFRMSANNNIVVEEEVPLHEAMDLYYRLKEIDVPQLKERKEKLLNEFDFRKIREKRYSDEEDEDEDYDEYDDDLIDGEEPTARPKKTSLDDFDPNIDEGDPNEMPSSFIFDSSVVFLSNLTREEIDPAVFDRFITVRVELTPIEFMNKLEEALPSLGNLDPAITKVAPDQFLWAKKVVFILLKAITEAWALNEKIMGVDINIKKRSLTFRLVTELANDLLRLGRNEIQKLKLKGTLSDSTVRDRVIAKCEKQILTKAIRKVVFGE